MEPTRSSDHGRDAGYEEVLAFWFAGAEGDPVAAAAREGFWFGGSADADARVRERFASTVDAAGRGELDAWRQAPHPALALVLVLDQFPRNLWRGSGRAFAHDAHALGVAREALERGFLPRLAPLEQAFLLLPLQHSERAEDQRESVRRSEDLVRAAPPEWRPLLEHYAHFARQHRDLIERFGRFPHRNRALGRTPTREEEAWLRGGGPSFGQGETGA